MLEIYFTFFTSLSVVCVNSSGIRTRPLILIALFADGSMPAILSPALPIELGDPVVAACTLAYFSAAPPHADKLPNMKPLHAPSIAPCLPFSR